MRLCTSAKAVAEECICLRLWRYAKWSMHVYTAVLVFAQNGHAIVHKRVGPWALLITFYPVGDWRSWKCSISGTCSICSWMVPFSGTCCIAHRPRAQARRLSPRSAMRFLSSLCWRSFNTVGHLWGIELTLSWCYHTRSQGMSRLLRFPYLLAMFHVCNESNLTASSIPFACIELRSKATLHVQLALYIWMPFKCFPMEKCKLILPNSCCVFPWVCHELRKVNFLGCTRPAWPRPSGEVR